MSEKKFRRNKQEKIDLIYDTFFNLIIDKGYHKTSTNHIAEKAGVSIGTIYKYFPNGKQDIMRKYFEETMENVLKSSNLFNVDENKIRDFLKDFILVLYKNHKEKKGYNIAFRSAIQSDKILLEAHKERLSNSFKEASRLLREKNEIFKKIPEERLIKIFIFLYNLINALIYHHLSVMKLFDTDSEFTDYLSNLTAFSLQYLNNRSIG
jgi:AcrR family transcriptional regulator